MATTATKPLDKKAQFKKVAEARTDKALKAISLISNCASKQSYEYTAEQVSKIMAALRGEVDKVEKRFANPSTPSGGGFSL